MRGPNPLPASEKVRQRAGPEEDRKDHQHQGERAPEKDFLGLKMLEVGDL
jgi:hypothetical protein